MYDLITVNAGHNSHVQGANSKYGKEHEEARKVTAAVIKELKSRGEKVVSTTCDDHKTKNSILQCQARQCNNYPKSKRLDVSIHFNAFNGKALGAEVLYYSAKTLAAKVSSEIAKAGGFTDRGAKERKELYFLRSTNASAILIEVCFIDNKSDMDKYKKNFDSIVNAIVDSITNKKATKPKEKYKTSAPKPTDGELWRIKTGTFANAKEYSDALQKLKSKYSWLIYEKADSTEVNPNYRIITGTFTGKNVTEFYAAQLKKDFGWTVYIEKA